LTKESNEELRPAKTLWDWLQLVAVPLALAVLAIVFNNWQSGRDAKREEASASLERAIAREARLDAVLQKYLSQLSNLVLDHALLTSREGSNVREVARTLTLAAIRRLDGSRKGEVVRYLTDTGLIAGRTAARHHGFDSFKLGPPIIGLADADLRHANLRNLVIDNASLSGADLRGANFDGAEISDVDFTSTRAQAVNGI
jgi:hypothetical protein